MPGLPTPCAGPSRLRIALARGRVKTSSRVFLVRSRAVQRTVMRTPAAFNTHTLL
jgi:hypothetical protein